MIKFKGTVNGKEYDSVQEYNQAIANALANGESINANSRTWDESEDNDKKDCPANHPNDDSEIDFTSQEWAPVFDLDKLTGEDSDDEMLQAFLDRITPEKAVEICEKLDNLDDEELQTYAKVIRDILNDLSRSHKITKKATPNIHDNINNLNRAKANCQNNINNLQEKISNINKQLINANKSLVICDRAEDVLVDSEKFFTIIAKELSSRLFDIANKKSHIQGRETPGKEFLFNPQVEGFNRLLKEIFGA
jgi:hypothetical protein